MRQVDFTKMVASGNDFVIIDGHKAQVIPRLRSGQASRKSLAKNICDRKFGVGSDGLLVLEKSKKADIRMRIFNADGSEAEMCGNGARCVAQYMGRKNIKIETKAGIIKAQVRGDNVKIKLTEPKNIKLNIPVKINNRLLRVNFINTGVPHAVVFVEGLDKIDVCGLGRQIRFHKSFAPAGTNVNFIEVLNNNYIKIRTYERGVENETLACGTGSAASALVFVLKSGVDDKINVHTKSGEVLKVYFEKEKDKFGGVWLEGKARIVYSGVYNV